MKQRTVGACVIALVAVAAVGCGDDPAGPSGDTLEEARAVELAEAMLSASSALALDGATPPQGLNASADPTRSTPAAVQTVNIQWRHTAPCPVGGDVEVDGSVDMSYDDETREVDAEVTASLTHLDCAFDVDGTVITTNGDPDLDLAASVHKVAGQPEGEQSVSLSGSFTWQDDEDRGGECDVDLDGSLAMEEGTVTRTLQGSFCGHTIDQTVTIEQG
ncbi:MAG: hypothetical protein ACODAE_06505 [Gemmatimonadota bacterium]